MPIEIKQYKKENTIIISKLFPKDWNFDFEKFISLHIDQNYFIGFTLSANNEPIGFGNLMIFGEVGWIGNIVVKKTFRGKGLGTSITNHLIETGENAGVKTFNLIATELGKSVYKNMGFRTELNYEFYKPSESFKKFEITRNIGVASKADFQKIIDLDFTVTREKRNKFIELFLSGTKLIYNSTGKLKGFFIENLENGLIIANESGYGLELLKVKLNNNGHSLVIPETNLSAKDFLVKNGYKNYINAPRMILGKKYNWKSESVFSRGAGYCG
ncbi:MAG: GNAT family N-acetyltransferase [Bacteroidetes bacterium]|nr:GNAT family N-acetyltransferase [Bacteroidota bacterium]